MYPERNALAESRGDYYAVGEHWRAAASRELMMRRYLGESERARFEQIGARKRRGWLLGRIAIKDACRLHLWKAGEGPMFPVEVAVDNEPSGKPIATVRGRRLHVSVAHKDDLAVAIVSDDTDVGIDLERIAPRAETFDAVAFTPAELALGTAFARDEWQTRLWAAKEAVGKARGTGLSDPRRVVVRAVDGERLTIDDGVVETRREGDYIVAWTVSHGRLS
jgi:phosphopantetheinyl transferase